MTKLNLFKKYILKECRLIIVPVIAMIASIGIDSAYPYLQKIFIDEVITGNTEKYVVAILTSFVVLAAVQGVFGYIKEYQFDKFAVTICRQLRRDLYSKFQSFEFAFFDNNNTGELLSRIIEDVDVVWDTLAFGMRLIIEAGILFVSCVSIMCTINVKLTMLCVIILLPVVFIAKKMDKKFWDVYSQISDMTAEINSTVQQDVSGIRLVKAFAREKYEISKFLKTNNKFYDLNIEQAKILGVYWPIIEFLTNCAPILIIVYGGYLCINKELTLGSLVAFTSYIFSLSWCVRNLGSFINMLSQNKASMGKITKILNRKLKIVSKKNAYNPKHVKGDIEFRNVSFSYNDEEILHNINLKIKSGSKVAIMGTTGAGKTTITSLISRFYDHTFGTVKIDGINIKEVNLESLRSQMGIMLQDSFLFSSTIKENVKYGKLDATDEEVINACKAVNAHEFIEKLDKGYDTEVNERGSRLSLGQRQLIAFARALISNPRILILDEATANIDTETELLVQEGIKTLMKGRTSIVIAHRLSTIRDCDKIFVLSKGKIVESGTHEELLSKHGYYYNLYCAQYRFLQKDA